uniref:NADH-ubiquinone oxidoreductase chain 2 n=1 Tax=Pujadella villari TaxID=2943468 RepID=A0A9E8K0E3_9HYME|nr:NADH dehydrogenase subunit 2 [Pujadella villari]
MMMNFNLMTFMSLLIISIMIGINSNSMLFFWMTIEINMMSFIPIMIFYNKFYNDSPMKYLLIQSFSSSFMIFFSIFTYISMSPLIFLMTTFISIFIKLGVAPFFYWYLNMLINMSWMNCLILLTVQKILPFYILNYFTKFFNFMNLYIYYIFYSLILINSIISISLIYSTNSIKFLLGLSSLNHMSWLMFNLTLNFKMWLTYYLIYSLTLTNMIYYLNYFKINFLNQLPLIYSNTFNLKMFMFITIMTMMSLPPMTTFFLKSWSIFFFSKYNLNMFMYIMMMMSIIMFFFYMKLFLPSFTWFSLNMNNNINYNIKIFNMNKFIKINLLLIASILFYWTLNF